MTPPAAIHKKAAELGKLAVRMTAKAGAGHPSSALSLAHLVTYLMYKQMRYDPANPWNPAADRLVLSEGHAVPIVYAAYADLGGVVGHNRETARPLTIADLDGLRARDSILDGHPNPAEGFPFFDAATGSLGMGLSVAAGLALASRLDGIDRHIYAIVGDGESREGQIWEAADFIADYALTNITVFLNCNGQGQAGNVSPQQAPEKLAAKLQAFGWETITLYGHDPVEIEQALAQAKRTAKPLAIVARTIKGWGADQLQQGNWHGKPPKEADLPAICASIDKTIAPVADEAAPALKPPPPSATAHPNRPHPREAAWPSFSDAMAAHGLGDALKKNALATRRAYGVALKIAGDLLPQIAVLDGDVSNSTFTEFFAKAHPNRFFECKIAEQNMVSAAAGLAAAGYIPFANSFAKFIARAYDQVELANISRANVKLVGSHAGITPCSDGPSQMGLLDVAYFHSLTTVRGDDRETPLCWLLQPADALTAFHCTRLMVEHHGMCYMRTFRPDIPLLYAPETRFELGGFQVLNTGDDLAIVAAGYMVHAAKQAVEKLAKQGIRATLIDAYCLPIHDTERLRDVLHRAGGRVLTVEDNYGGGLGSAIAELAARAGNLRVEPLFCRRIPKSTREPAEILDYCGVGPDQIADQARALRERPG